jgi:phosphomannomutase
MAEGQELVERFTGGGATPAGAAVEHVGQVTARDDAAVLHAEAVAGLVDVEAIRGAKLNVVVDSVSGAGGDGARALLERLGVGLTHLYPWPTGRFPHPPEPTEENLRGLCEAVRTYRADLGMAQDTDADRLALVDAEGRYIGEEYTLVLCAMARLAGGQVERATMAANLSTSRMLDDLAREHGGRVVRTPVGEAHVAAAIRDRDALLGGEGNGGIIDPRVSYVRDSLVGMALVLELMATQRATLAELVDRLPRYAMVKDKMPADDAVKAALPDLPERVFRGRPVDRRDGVRVDWEDRWVQVRASNTEPIVRVMAEAPDQAGARELVRRVWEALDT